MIFKKYILTTILASTFFIAQIQQAQAAFSDVPANHPNFQAVQYIKSENLVKGYADGTYKPNRAIKRSEFTKIIIGSSFTEEEINHCMNTTVQPHWTYIYFVDIPREDLFAKWICIAKREGIIKGYADGTFKPNQNISFMEAAKIILNTLNFKLPTSDPWFKSYIEKLEDKNAIPTSIIKPDQKITRGEMAEILYRIKTNTINKDSSTYNKLMGIEEELLEEETEEDPFIKEPEIEEDPFIEEPALEEIPFTESEFEEETMLEFMYE